MPTKDLKIQVMNLTHEVATLRSLVIGLVREKKDPEGEYRVEFIKRVLKAAQQPAQHTFTGGKEFLKHLRAQ